MQEVMSLTSWYDVRTTRNQTIATQECEVPKFGIVDQVRAAAQATELALKVKRLAVRLCDTVLRRLVVVGLRRGLISLPARAGVKVDEPAVLDIGFVEVNTACVAHNVLSAPQHGTELRFWEESSRIEFEVTIWYRVLPGGLGGLDGHRTGSATA